MSVLPLFHCAILRRLTNFHREWPLPSRIQFLRGTLSVPLLL
uniref:Uncharacterized protein n=1 Tax=Anguilla anguilla TaxID=7936 RepID=A0A0E9XWA9_ANGAN